MEKVLVINTQVPFLKSGAEALERGLINALSDLGYTVDCLRLFEKWQPLSYTLKMIIQAKLIELESVPIEADKVIALKFPSYYIEHPNKSVWFLHHFRVFYELWDTEFCKIEKNLETEALRRLIIQSDTYHLKLSRKIFAISKTVAERLRKYNGINVEVLYPPLENSNLFKCNNFENYFFYPSRITPLKRQDLVVEAFKFIKSDFKLLIVGKVEDESYLKALINQINEYELNDRVKILTDQPFNRIVDYYSNCYAVVYPTFQEDYGYITLEAFCSKKPVISCTDSGGPSEFIEHGVNGMIVKPNAQDLAEAMEKLLSHKSKAIEMGKNGFEKFHSLNLSWKTVAERLISE